MRRTYETPRAIFKVYRIGFAVGKRARCAWHARWRRVPEALGETGNCPKQIGRAFGSGAAAANAKAVADAVARIKRHTSLPVCVGFGIRTPEAAQAIAERADGAVVGTALVDALRGSLDPDGRATARTVNAVASLAASLAQGVKGARQAAE